MWTTDTQLALTFVQGLLLRRLKITPERLLGRTLQDLLLDGREDHPLVQGHLAAVAGHENTVRIEWGGDIYSARLAPLRDGTGTIVGVVGVQQQIGWLPDDEGTLREVDVRLRRAIDANLTGIAFGNEDGQITEANDAFLEMTGFTREDLTADGISWPSLVPVEFHQRQVDAIDEMKHTGRCGPFEIELIRRDGRRVQVIVGGARLSAQRREGVAFVVDVSASKRATRNVAAELAAADALLEQPAPEGAIVRTLEILCRDLGWQTAMFWRQGQTGVCILSACHGPSPDTDGTIEAMARRAITDEEMLWSAPIRTLVIPFLPGERGACALMLVSPPNDTPEAGVVSASRAIGLRLAKALVRKK
jgi:PAS domain S-box-containing protein